MIRRCNLQFCQTKRSFPLEACLSDGSQRSRHGPCNNLFFFRELTIKLDLPQGWDVISMSPKRHFLALWPPTKLNPSSPQQESAHHRLEDWLLSRPPSRVYLNDNLPTFAAVATSPLSGPRDRLGSHYLESFTHLINHAFTQRQLEPIEKLCAAACAIPSCIPVSGFIIPPHVLTTASSTMHVLAIKFRQPVAFPALQQTAAVASELSTRFARFALLVRKAIVASTKPWRLSLLGLLL